MEKGVALEDGYPIMISGPTKLRSMGTPRRRKMLCSLEHHSVVRPSTEGLDVEEDLRKSTI